MITAGDIPGTRWRTFDDHDLAPTALVDRPHARLAA